MLTVYGIETISYLTTRHTVLLVATVLTVYGIETGIYPEYEVSIFDAVATVLTVYGIETASNFSLQLSNTITLQQCLPFTVLKLHKFCH